MDIHQGDVHFLQEVLRIAENDPSIVISSVDVSPCCKDGDNYMALVSRVKVRGTRGQDKQEYRRSVVTKQQPASLARREMFRCGPVFRNETAVYSTVIPAFESFFGKMVSLPFPKCLHADHRIRDDIIVLQDLGPYGFTMTDRVMGLDLDHCRLVLQSLARYHAMSLAMKRLDPKTFKKARDSIEEVIYIQDAANLFSVSMENSLKMATESLRVLSGNNGTYDVAIKIINRFSGEVFEIMSELVKPKEPWSVICHGDCWNNNIMFLYRNGQVHDLRLVDLQVARYSSPAIDILHFLYTSTQADLRRQHYEDLLRIYHKTLSETQRRLLEGSPYTSEKEFMTFKELKEEVESHALYGFLNALWLLPAVQADSTKVPDMESLTEDDFYSQENLDRWISHQTPKYRESIRDLLQEYTDRGFL
ncbi:uncharacterized protein [Periplaneta americana]|uniref:uncharacterized protein n=1 Tax=Periplaneta americana TaxID=6978 RepID=UPI0037E7E7E1